MALNQLVKQKIPTDKLGFFDPIFGEHLMIAASFFDNVTE